MKTVQIFVITTLCVNKLTSCVDVFRRERMCKKNSENVSMTLIQKLTM